MTYLCLQVQTLKEKCIFATFFVQKVMPKLYYDGNLVVKL